MEISNTLLNLNVELDVSPINEIAPDEITINFNGLLEELLTANDNDATMDLSITDDNAELVLQIEKTITEEDGIDIAAGGNILPIAYELTIEPEANPNTLSDNTMLPTAITLPQMVQTGKPLEDPQAEYQPTNIQIQNEFTLEDMPVKLTHEPMPESTVIKLTENIEQTEYNPLTLSSMRKAENSQSINDIDADVEKISEDNSKKGRFPIENIANIHQEKLLNNNQTYETMTAPALNALNHNYLSQIKLVDSKELEIENHLTPHTNEVSAEEISFRQDLPSITNQQPLDDSQVHMNTNIDIPIESDHWQEQMAGKIHWLTGQSVKSAKIHINPPELGPIDAQIKMLGKGAEIVLTSHHSEIREAMEQMLPRLKELLSENNVNLHTVDITEQKSQNQDQAQEHRQGQQRTEQQDTENRAFTTPILSTTKPEGIVDYYA